MERACVSAMGQPLVLLPGDVSRRAGCDFFDYRMRHSRFEQWVIVGKHRLETRMETSVRDAPGANVFLKLVPRIDRAHVQKVDRAPTARTLASALHDHAGREGIRVVTERWQVHANLRMSSNYK